jgi:hypothetical protein
MFFVRVLRSIALFCEASGANWMAIIQMREWFASSGPSCHHSYDSALIQLADISLKQCPLAVGRECLLLS